MSVLCGCRGDDCQHRDHPRCSPQRTCRKAVTTHLLRQLDDARPVEPATSEQPGPVVHVLPDPRPRATLPAHEVDRLVAGMAGLGPDGQHAYLRNAILRVDVLDEPGSGR